MKKTNFDYVEELQDKSEVLDYIMYYQDTCELPNDILDNHDDDYDE